MSSSTIRTTIRPGQRTVEQLAARRQQMLAARGSLADQFAAERAEQLGEEGVEAAEELGGLLGRLDAAADQAGRRELSKTLEVLDEATAGGSIEEAREAVERLEAESMRGWADRTERELLLDELAERAGVRIKEGTKQMQADGRLTASVEIPEHGTVPLSLSGGRSAGNPDGSAALWRAVDSDIRGDGTQEGACKAQHKAIDAVAEKLGDQMTVEDDEAEREPAPHPHQVSRGAQ
jgi:hypothetical protein